MYNEFSVPHEVFEDPKFKKLSSNAYRLYCVLCKLKNRYANQDGYFWRSMAMLTEDTGLSNQEIQRAKKELLSQRFIEILRGEYTETKFRAPDWYKLNGFKEYS